MEQLVFISHSSADKAVADAICHYLEDAGIRCWIAPRDIRISDWATSIMDGLRRSNVFVVVISQNSIHSQEVTKEVTEATHTCQYILPFKVDNEDLSDRLRYHLGPCHWLDAVSPPLEKRLEELKQRIFNLSDEDAVYMNTNQWKLESRTMWPRGLFVGREQEIEEIAEMLEEDHVLFLQGMGGIGKSEIAKGYAKTYADQYDTIIFATYTSNLLDLVISDEIPITNLKRSMAQGEDEETPEAYFARKLQVLKSLSSKRTLLIVDNFDVEWDEHFEDLASGSYDLLITTRCEHLDYPCMNIRRIEDFDKVRQIFTSSYGRPIAAKDMGTVDEILKLVNCHTITVELIAKQMRASFVKPEKMLKLLQGEGMNTRLKEKVKREGVSAQRTAFDTICQLFQLSGLTEDEQKILSYMIFVPVSGIEVGLFGEFAYLEDYDVINKLLSKSWLMLDEETDMLKLHPVIGDVVREQLNPTPASCREYVHGLWERMHDCWYFTVEERAQMAPYVIHFQRNYPVPCDELWQEYSDFVNMAWICGYFEQSIKSGHIFYEWTLEHYGENDWRTGEAATYLAGAYHNSGDDDSAEHYYRIGLNIRLKTLPEDDFQIGISYSKLGRCAYQNHDFERAEYELGKAIEVFENRQAKAKNEEERKDATWRSGDTVVEFERMYMEMGEYEKALEWCQKSYDLFYMREQKEIPNSIYSLVDMGICCSKLGRYEEAEKYLNRALALNIEYNGEASRQTMRTRESIADNTYAQGNHEEAARLYEALELELEKDFGETNPQVIRLRKKRESLGTGQF